MKLKYLHGQIRKYVSLAFDHIGLERQIVLNQTYVSREDYTSAPQQ